MARPRYTLTKDDGFTAWKWIDTKLRTLTLDVSQTTKVSNAARKSLNATRFGKNIKALNLWAETYMSSKEWVQLKNVLRAHKKRNKDKLHTNRGSVSTNLTRGAHVILRELAIHYKVTQSEIIVKYLDKEFLKISKQKE